MKEPKNSSTKIEKSESSQVVADQIQNDGDDSQVNLVEEEVFSTLSHPLRRDILKSIYATRQMSFTDLKEDIASSTGSIYHHLEKLDKLISQNEKKQYILSEAGIKLVEQYLNPSEKRVEVKRIESFTQVTQSLFNTILERRSELIFLVGIFVFAGNLVVSEMGTIVLGAVIVPRSNTSLPEFPLFSIIYTILLFTLYWVMVKTMKGSVEFLRLVQIYMMALGVVNFILVIIFVMYLLITLSISLWLYAIINLVCQIIFLTVITAGNIQYQGLTVVRSISISFVLLYTGLFMNILLWY